MRVGLHLGVPSDQRHMILSFIKIWWWTNPTRGGGGSSELLAAPLAGGLRPRWETGRYVMRRELGYKVCLPQWKV